ncbi:MAG: leucine-rich repeat protein [Bacteroidaceae bacterium]|nr:leucine-rich repeat protein [Bacteroidaceae bacterium]
MKRLLGTIIIVFYAIGAYCVDISIDRISYSLDTTSKTAAVVSCSKSVSGAINIPNTIEYNSAKYTVTNIGNYAFYYCTGLISITILNSVTSIGERAFSGCSSLTSIDIPNSVTSIGVSAFSGCSSLTSVTISNSVTIIEDYTFNGCTGLMSIEIPNSVTNIGDWAFYGCSSLTSINIPNSVTSIGDSAFSYCSSLTSINIPNSVTSIGSYAFYDCKRLNFVVVDWDSPLSISSNVFSGITLTKRTLTVPHGTKSLYSSAIGWKEFEAIIEKDAPILATSISLNKTSSELFIGDSMTLIASISPDNATNKNIEWSSSDNSVVSVSNGFVSALSSGTCIVTAKTTDGSNKTATCNVTVKKHPQTIDWNQDLSSIMSGGELVELLATSSSGLPIVFSSSDENVACIFDMGNAVYLNPVNSGMAKITATQAGDNYYEATSVAKDVNVIDPSGVESIMVDNSKYVIHTISGICIGVFSKEEYNSFIKNKLTKGIYIVNGKKYRK